MWIVRKIYVRAVRRQQPIYKNLFNGRPVSRVISSEGDLMGDLEYDGHDDNALMQPTDSVKESEEAERYAIFIKRVWAGIQYCSVVCLLCFQLSLTVH